MLIKYNIDIEPKTIEVNLQRIVNLIYKLLPIREEGADWRCKLEGIYTITEENDFSLYRKTIFECLNLVGELIKKCQV